jgi:hypothetical protein
VSSEPQSKPLPRRYILSGLGVLVLALAFILFSQTSLNLSFIRPESTGEAILLASISALIFLLFVALTFVLARNLFKAFAERRLGVLGSRFRVRMVIGALLLSFLPTIFLFLFSYVLMNRSIEKWFSRPIEQLNQDTGNVAQLLTSFAKENAQAKAAWLAEDPAFAQAIAKGDLAGADDYLSRHRAALQDGTVMLLEGDKVLHRWSAGQPLAVALPLSESTSAQFALGRIALGKKQQIAVALPLPKEFSSSLSRVEQSQQGYSQLKAQQKQLRSFYMRMLLLLTVLTLFASTWLSLFIARLVTRPVAALAEATKQIRVGHFGHRVEVPAADELGELVSSFNEMARELDASRQRLERSGRELADANIALGQANTDLERRTNEIITLLENIPSGVLSLDADGKITHSNRAFKNMFSREKTPFGAQLEAMLDPALAIDVRRLLRKADRMGTSAREVETSGLHLEVTAASLIRGRARLGYVVVFEDLSELLKAQKQSAWREVARRVAHEIKNPLTPILLSAERIRKHLDRSPVPEPASLAVIHGSAETISGAVDSLRQLVDEFSTLARFPAAEPKLVDVNELIHHAVAMFNGRLDGIILKTQLASSLPRIIADAEGVKRVVANLIDNAAEAMQDSLVKEIDIRTQLVDPSLVEISVSDTGHGITPDLKERLFLPYFSTKDRGTGLGLAIVSRVVEDHHGTIRVEENKPVGARFIVELPVQPHA